VSGAIDPQPGLHVGNLDMGVVEVGVLCVISQVTPFDCKSLSNVTKKACGSFVGTVAVVGVRCTPMPDASTIVIVPVLDVFCWDWAVKIN